MTNYPAPLDQFLTLGEPRSEDWRDYRAVGVGPEHVPDLIRMATDPELNTGDPDTPQVWAPLHAWRALGQLRAAEAVAPLLQLMQEEDDNDGDAGLEELPVVFGLIGPAAVPEVAAFLADPNRGLYARWAAARALQEIAQKHPEARAECVAALVRQMERSGENDPTLNGALVACLLDLHAVEAAPALERAFADEDVDESIAGGWEDARYALGLRPDPPPKRFYDHLHGASPAAAPPRGPHSPKERAKARRKQAKKSRQRNRKKK